MRLSVDGGVSMSDSCKEVIADLSEIPRKCEWKE